MNADCVADWNAISTSALRPGRPWTSYKFGLIAHGAPCSRAVRDKTCAPHIASMDDEPVVLEERAVLSCCICLWELYFPNMDTTNFAVIWWMDNFLIDSRYGVGLVAVLFFPLNSLTQNWCNHRITIVFISYCRPLFTKFISTYSKGWNTNKIIRGC